MFDSFDSMFEYHAAAVLKVWICIMPLAVAIVVLDKLLLRVQFAIWCKPLLLKPVAQLCLKFFLDISLFLKTFWAFASLLN